MVNKKRFLKEMLTEVKNDLGNGISNLVEKSWHYVAESGILIGSLTGILVASPLIGSLDNKTTHKIFGYDKWAANFCFSVSEIATPLVYAYTASLLSDSPDIRRVAFITGLTESLVRLLYKGIKESSYSQDSQTDFRYYNPSTLIWKLANCPRKCVNYFNIKYQTAKEKVEKNDEKGK